MTRTGFAAEEFAASELALGYRRGPNGWEEVPFDPYGAFAPMGGVFSCVADLTTWSAGFAAAFAPGAGGDLIAHRLRMAAAWAGPVAPGGYQAGDGTGSLVVELIGAHATITLSLLVNAATSELRQADVML